jgi:hypothetical protein
MRPAPAILASLLFCPLLTTSCSSETSGPPCDTADKYEPNETASAAKDLGGFTDDPDSSLKVDLTAHVAGDVDFFRFKVTDEGFGGDPIVTISAPEGYELTTWFTCARGAPKTFTCLRGKEIEDPSVTAGKGCQNEQPSGSISSTTDCDADEDDDGEILLRVKKLDTSNVCSSKFDITIEVE